MEEGTIGKLGQKFVVDWARGEGAEILPKYLTKLGISLSKVVDIRECGGWKKTDILITDEEGRRVGLSLKTRGAGQPDDHLDRRWLDRTTKRRKSWKDVLGMPNRIVEAFREGLARKAQNSRADFIAPEFREDVRKFLLEKLEVILREAFVGGEEEELQLFAVLEYGTSTRLTIFRMDEIIEFVCRNVKEKGIHFGGNIRLGDYIWIQRKAGDRKGLSLPKTDPKHPGNQIQVKVLPLELRDDAIRCRIKCCDIPFHKRLF